MQLGNTNGKNTENIVYKPVRYSSVGMTSTIGIFLKNCKLQTIEIG